MKPYSIIIQYSTISDLKREAARLLGEDIDKLHRALGEALDDAATLRESLAEARKKLAEALAEVERLRGAAPPIPGPTARDGVVGMLVRCDFEGYAAEIAERKREPAEIAHEIRSWWTSDRPGRDACIAALEALAARETCPVGHGSSNACAECAPNEQQAQRRQRAHIEHLGRVVHEIWIDWAREQPSSKSSWLAPWEALSEPDREVDRRIGEQLFAMGLAAGRAEVQQEAADLRRMLQVVDARARDAEAALDDWRVATGVDSPAAAKVDAEADHETAANLRAEVETLRRTLEKARANGATEMRERAACALGDQLVRVGGVLRSAADVVRALPLDGGKVEEKR